MSERKKFELEFPAPPGIEFNGTRYTASEPALFPDVTHLTAPLMNQAWIAWQKAIKSQAKAIVAIQGREQAKQLIIEQLEVKVVEAEAHQVQAQKLYMDTIDTVDEIEAKLADARNGVIPEDCIRKLAELEMVDNHDENGPGWVWCPCCDATQPMRWERGNRQDFPTTIKHDQNCAHAWAKKQIESTEPPKG